MKTYNIIKGTSVPVQNVGIYTRPAGRKVVKGELFIVPNSCGTLKKDFFSPEGVMKNLRKMTGVLANYEDHIIQVWATGANCDNWSDHYGVFTTKACGLPDGDKTYSFPKYFPSRIFRGMKEGDQITFHSDELDIDFELTLTQLKYRYKSWGTWEETFKQVTPCWSEEDYKE